MALKLVKIEKFSETVAVRRPTDRDGVSREETFTCVFRHVHAEEFQQMIEDIKDGTLTNKELLHRVLTDVKDVYDAEGKQVDFETCREYICENLDLSNATVGKFVEALHGSKGKNSNGSRRG